MRWVAIVVFLILGTVIGILFNNSTGQAVFFYDGWQVEVPIWMMVLLVVLFSCILAVVVRCISKVEYLSVIAKHFFDNKRVKDSHIATQRSLELMILGDFDKADKLAEKAANLNEQLGAVNKITLAKLANETGDLVRRDEIIASLSKDNPENANTYMILLAKLKLQNNEIETAHKILLDVYDKSRNKESLRLLTLSSIRLEEFEYLERMLAPIKRSKVFPQNNFDKFQDELFSKHIDKTAKHHGAQELQALWKRIPKKTRQNPNIKAKYVNALQMLGLDESAAKLLHEYLTKGYEHNLFMPLVENKSMDLEQKRKLLEKWLKSNSHDTCLLEALGTIYMQRGIHGKAMSLFEEVISTAPSSRIYALMGELLEDMGEPDKAKSYYKKGAMFRETSAPFLLENTSVTTTG